ncbi:unnamed protein product, partial [Rotaria sordida]
MHIRLRQRSIALIRVSGNFADIIADDHLDKREFTIVCYLIASQ